jgi:hypothetical protein
LPAVFEGPSKKHRRNFYQASLEFRPALLLTKQEAETNLGAFIDAFRKRLQKEGIGDYYGRASRKAGVTFTQLRLPARVYTVGQLEGVSNVRELIESDRNGSPIASSGTLDRYQFPFTAFIDTALTAALTDAGLFKESAYLIAIFEVGIRMYRRTKGK